MTGGKDPTTQAEVDALQANPEFQAAKAEMESTRASVQDAINNDPAFVDFQQSQASLPTRRDIGLPVRPPIQPRPPGPIVPPIEADPTTPEGTQVLQEGDPTPSNVRDTTKAAFSGFNEDLQKIIVGKKEYDPKFDFDGDGEVTIRDSVKALRYQQGLETPPPELIETLKSDYDYVEGVGSQAGFALDDAQQEYSDAMGQLTQDQQALSGVEQPSFDTVALDDTIFTDDIPFLEAGVNDSFKDLINEGKLPADLTDYTITGSRRNFTITFGDGTTIESKQKTTGRVQEQLGALIPKLETFKQSDDYTGYLRERGDYDRLVKNVEDSELAVNQAQANVATAQKQFETTDIPSTAEALGKAITSPEDLLKKPTVYGLKVENNQLIDEGTGQVATAATLLVKQAEAADAVEDPAVKATLAYLNKLTDEEKQQKYPLPPNATPDQIAQVQAQIDQDAKKATAETYESVMSQDKVKASLEEFAAAVGVPSEDALMKAEQMDPEELAQLDLDPAVLNDIRQIPEVKRQLEEGEVPTAALFDEYTKVEEQKFEGDVKDIDAAKFEDETPRAEPAVDYNLPPTQIAEQEATKVQDAAKFAEYATAPEKQSEFVPSVEDVQGTVKPEEIADLEKILNSEEIIVPVKTLEALQGDAVAKAQSASFTQQLEAKLVKGEVTAASTVQGQLANLMDQFNDGTPAWAAGALRKVTAAMNARGLGGSSMASVAMIQAAMESAIPIAQADAATFQAMNMENVRNAQAVALANASAAQNFELANLNNRQSVELQNSMNNANLQLKNLSNEQEAVLANAQIKAALQEQEVSVSANVQLANAARYAAANDMNLTNRQQSAILKSSQNLEIEMANLSNAQQTALSNLQVKASMMGQELTNEQQMAVLETTQAFEAEMGDATRRQQAFIQDAAAIAALEGRVLDNKQQTSLFNVSNQLAERELELNNEQQTRIFNMTNKLTIGLEELSGRQQAALANAQIESAMKGQELTNKQQVAVIKAERIAEVANMNFTEEQTRVLRQSEMALSVDLANLSNKQAKLMADCAALTEVDMANLNNRQQAQAQNAQAFLQMDMANLDNEQQAVMFEAQSLVQSVFSDQAAENAQLQFNAESINQVNQFFDNLSVQVSQFNNAQTNAMEQFNVGEENSMAKFQAELDNQRDLFNAQNEMVVAQANTAWRQSVATANTAALNEANMNEVMAANNMTMQGLNELWQQERDLMDFAFKVGDNELERDHEVFLLKLKNDGDIERERGESLGNFASQLFTNVLFGAGNFSGVFGGATGTGTAAS